MHGQPHNAVFDLPQVYEKPSYDVLLAALDSLKLKPANWTSGSDNIQSPAQNVPVTRYLMSVVSSPLSWLDDDQQETIWDEASKRIAERSGTTALPAMTRQWSVPGRDRKSVVDISLHEPGLTGDNLGLKTWGSSYLMAKRLPEFSTFLPGAGSKKLQVLELGAGTGLVGIAAALAWDSHVTLTDLPEISDNLQKNVDLNDDLYAQENVAVPRVEILDWSDPPDIKDIRGPFDVVLAADPLYDPHHAPMLAANIHRFLTFEEHSRVIVMHPLRDEATRGMGRRLQKELAEMDFGLLESGEAVGYDDWEVNGERAEIRCWWGVWSRKAVV